MISTFPHKLAEEIGMKIRTSNFTYNLEGYDGSKVESNEIVDIWSNKMDGDEPSNINNYMKGKTF